MVVNDAMLRQTIEDVRHQRTEVMDRLPAVLARRVVVQAIGPRRRNGLPVVRRLLHGTCFQWPSQFRWGEGATAHVVGGADADIPPARPSIPRCPDCIVHGHHGQPFVVLQIAAQRLSRQRFHEGIHGIVCRAAPRLRGTNQARTDAAHIHTVFVVVVFAPQFSSRFGQPIHGGRESRRRRLGRVVFWASGPNTVMLLAKHLAHQTFFGQFQGVKGPRSTAMPPWDRLRFGRQQVTRLHTTSSVSWLSSRARWASRSVASAATKGLRQ